MKSLTGAGQPYGALWAHFARGAPDSALRSRCRRAYRAGPVPWSDPEPGARRGTVDLTVFPG
jgi:hypothetical protein